MEKLYIINNIGCDATTKAVVKLEDNVFNIIKDSFKSINKSSYYDCMPRIYIEEYIIGNDPYDYKAGYVKKELSELDDKWDYSFIDGLFYKTYDFAEL